MKACPGCGAQSAEVDFCLRCGEYLRWDATLSEPVSTGARRSAGHLSAAGAAGAGSRTGPTVEPGRSGSTADAVLMTLRCPKREDASRDPVEVRVEPGERTSLRALVRNQSGIVDHFALSVEGLPREWWTITPPSLDLLPFRVGGTGCEAEAEITLHPPRCPEAEARRWPISVVASSRSPEGPSAREAATLEIAPYAEVAAEMRPERRAGRRQACFALTLADHGNASLDLELEGMDPEGACGFAFFAPRRGTPQAASAAARRALEGARARPEGLLRRIGTRAPRGTEPADRLRLGRGERASVRLRVRPPKQRWIGRPSDRPFQVCVTSSAEGSPPQVVAGTFRQRPWLAWWLMLLVPLAAAAAALLLTHGAARTTVPALEGQPSILAAVKLLEGSGLRIGNATPAPANGAAIGSVVTQDPPAGTRVDSGSAVDLTYARGPGARALTAVVGLTLDQARVALVRDGFQLGTLGNAPADPATSTIVGQSPAAGAPEPPGTPVTVTFGDAEPSGTTETAPSGTGSTTAPGTTTAPSPTTAPTTPSAPHARTPAVTVPPLGALAPAAAAQRLRGLHLTPTIVRQPSPDVPAGGVLAQAPRAGAHVAPGTTVTITVSSGYPDLVFDFGGQLFRTGADGRHLARLLSLPGILQQPSASPAGGLVAFRLGAGPLTAQGDLPSAQIWVVDPDDPAGAHAITPPGDNDRRPAISPDGKVVAFASDRGDPGGDTLCFVRVERPDATPDCLPPDPDVIVDRPSWSPDGRAILVIARARSRDTARVDLALYASDTPYSARAADWRSVGVVTGAMHGPGPNDQVTMAAWSPDGGTLAFAANWSGTFTLYLVKVQADRIDAAARAVPGIRACELAWSPASQIAVSERGDHCDGEGRIGRIDPRHPVIERSLTSVGAGNPTWLPPRTVTP